MAHFTYDEIIDKIHYGEEGSLQLSFNDCIQLQKILIERGYAVMLTDGDMAGDYRISWIYAGDIGNAISNRQNICFCSLDWLNELMMIPHIEEGEDE